MKAKVKQKLSGVSRRQALAMMGRCSLGSLALGPVEVLLSGLVSGAFLKAQAAANVQQPRNWFYINLAGGPPRWMFDLPLMPFPNSAGIIRNAHVNTCFRDAGAGQPIYKSALFTHGGVTLNMPSLWSSSIPTPGGGSVPMANLIENMAMIRGVNMRMDGHPDNNEKQVRPLGSAPSLGGLVADVSNKPIPAVGLPGGPNNAYRSSRGIGQTTLSSFTDPLTKILSPFDKKSDSISGEYLTRRQAMDKVVNLALESLSRQAKSSNPGSEHLYSIRNSAENLMRAGVGDLASEYAPLLAKYRMLINRAMSEPIAGVTDKPIRYSDMIIDQGFTPQTNIQEGFVKNSDLRSVIQASTEPRLLAEGFAVAEYLVKNGFSSAVSCGSAEMFNLNFEDLRSRDNPTGPGRTTNIGVWTYDEHFGGSVLSVIINSVLYRSLAACIYEFIQVMKKNNMFEETVIQVGSEFSRTPRNDQSGSDHGWMANCTSIYSGIIKRPIVVGNTYLDSTYAGGSWGASAPINIYGTEQELGIGHSTSTLARLLRVQPIVPNNGTLISESTSGGVHLLVEPAQNKVFG